MRPWGAARRVVLGGEVTGVSRGARRCVIPVVAHGLEPGETPVGVVVSFPI